MEILVTYDIKTVTKEGQKRLRRVAKVCEAFGFRVQDSVFECRLDGSEMLELRDRLESEIDGNVDSIAIYRLREPFSSYVVRLGADPDFGPDGPLFL